jgi:hypothetical protein
MLGPRACTGPPIGLLSQPANINGSTATESLRNAPRIIIDGFFTRVPL